MVMKVQITVDDDSARTEMAGEGTIKEISQVLVQLDILRFKLLKILDSDDEGSEFVAKLPNGSTKWGDD